MFRAIATENFPPFETFRIKTPLVRDKPNDLAEVHLFTGVNGTGKTRILSLLAALLGNPEPLMKRMPNMDRMLVHSTDMDSYPEAPDKWKNLHILRGKHFDISQNSGFADWARQVPAFAYSGAAYVTDAPVNVMGEIPKLTREVCLSFVRPPEHSVQLLQGIVNLKLQAAMDSLNEAIDESQTLSVVTALERTIAAITGRSFSFAVSSYPRPAIGVKWGTAKLPFDLLPDGLRSIIGWLAHSVVMMDVLLQGKRNPLQSEAVFLLDEVEGLLHPAWQRRILPAFQKLFPKAQIFVTTHSPFVIASLNYGWIHPLSLRKDGKVIADEPQPASQGDSYISVVEDIMGVKEWYDTETEQMLQQFRSLRDEAYKGDSSALHKARTLASQIGARSMELEYMMGRELSQMDRRLSTVK